MGRSGLAGMLVLALACSPEEEPTPPPILTTALTTTGVSPDSDTSTGAPGTTTGGISDACELGISPMMGSGSDTEEGFKFDVGSPDGGGFMALDCDQAADLRTNLGCEFFAVDLPNDPRGTTHSPPAADQQFSVAVGNPSGLSAALVEVFLPGESAAFSARSIEPGTAFTFELPSQSIEPLTTSTDGLAYRIVSDIPVTAYQFNPLDNTVEVYSNDASLLLPTHALGQEYTAITGDAILLGMSQDDTSPINSGAFVAVVAAQDNTRVTIDPTAQIVGQLNNPVNLDRGEVVNIVSTQSSGNGNLSGTRVSADAPVAVFAGNMATAVPFDSFACCADHLEHQMSPHEAWGSRYVVAPPAAPVGDDDPAVYRITGAFDGTELQYCPEQPPGAPMLLNAGQTFVFETDWPFSVRSVDPDHSFAIAQFLQSYQAIGGNRPGDPAMLIVPAAAQFERQFVFVVPAGYVENRVTIVARGEDGEVRLNGKRVNGWNELAVLDGLYHRYAQVALDEGQHIIEANTEVGVSVFGYDTTVSFAYPGGAGLRVISIPPAAG